MPVITERIEPGIYHNNWIGNVSMEDVYRASDQELVLLQEDDYKVFVSVVTATAVTKFPMNLSGMRSAIRDQAIATLIINAPRMGEVLAKMVARFTPNPIEFFNTREEALARARTILADFQKQNT